MDRHEMQAGTKPANGVTSRESGEKGMNGSPNQRNEDGDRLNKYWKYIRAIFVGDGLQSADCDELTQETYLRIAKQLRKGVKLPDSEDALRHWLVFHARCKRNDYWRSQYGMRGSKRQSNELPGEEATKRRPQMTNYGTKEPVRTDSRGRVRPEWFARSQEGEIRWKELLDVIRAEIGEKAVLVVDLWRRRFTQTEIASILNVDVKTIARCLAKAREIASRDL